jgi:hypothetical protein
MKKLTPQMLRRMVLEEKKKVEAAHAKENAKARKAYHLDEEEVQWSAKKPPHAEEIGPQDDMHAAKQLKEEEIRLRRRLQAIMERRLALKRRIMESL